MLQNSSPISNASRTTVIQGEAVVGSGRNEVLTTVLGSCIACCLYDPIARVGGMNHFLLAEPSAGTAVDAHYGVYLMELLINKMMAKGALKTRMKAHIYGGAHMHVGMSRIGDANAAFARGFLMAEGIELVRSDTGGSNARRLEFDPVQGRTRCRVIENVDPPGQSARSRKPVSAGDVELF